MKSPEVNPHTYGHVIFDKGGWRRLEEAGRGWRRLEEAGRGWKKIGRAHV